MKIAIISGTPACPPTEGNRNRILNLARAIRSLGHEVWFLYLPTWSLTDFDYSAHETEFGSERFIPLKGEVTKGKAPFYFRVRRKINKMIGNSDAFYNHLDEFYNPDWDKQLRSINQKHDFDAVFVEYIFHSHAFYAFPKKAIKVLDTHDTFGDRHNVFMNTSNPFGYWFSIPPQVECAGFRRADIILGIQEQEARSFSERLGRTPPSVLTISHLLDLTQCVNDYSPSGAVFLGAANDANILSMNYFLDKILPLILNVRPAFQLTLAGSICDRVLDRPSIVKLGRVGHAVDAFRKAPISLNPMLVGTGINIKLLDAMAAGVPTVSTRTGARGLPPNVGGGVFQVDDQEPQAFADAVVSLSDSQEARQEAGKKAFKVAIEWNKAQIDALRVVLPQYS